MGGDGLAVYGDWDLTRPAVPPRSRLFHLEPVGVGTPDVESLTGYVARLAAAHGVLVRTLLVAEIVPLWGRPYLAGAVNRGLSSFWQGETRALNGTRGGARDLVGVLESLTRRPDLRFLTMLPWAAVVPAKGLSRAHRAWCPACYEEWRQAGRVIYEPLLWTLLPVTACPRHRRRLRQVCPAPDCRRPSPPLGQRARPGHCSACGRWLGEAVDAEPAGGADLTGDALAAQRWVVAALGELLAGALDVPAPLGRPRMARLMARAIEEVAGGNAAAFARALGLDPMTVSQWRQGRAIPTLELLLQTCHGLGTTPLRFLTEDGGRAGSAPHAPTKARLVDAPRPPRPHARPFDIAETRLALEAVLASDEQPPPAMRQVARRLGRAHSELIHHLPELCRAISARYLAYQHARGAQRRGRLGVEIRQAAFQLHDQGLYPSACRIATMISQPGFVRDPEAISVRKEVLRELGWRT